MIQRKHFAFITPNQLYKWTEQWELSMNCICMGKFQDYYRNAQNYALVGMEREETKNKEKINKQNNTTQKKTTEENEFSFPSPIIIFGKICARAHKCDCWNAIYSFQLFISMKSKLMIFLIRRHQNTGSGVIGTKLLGIRRKMVWLASVEIST